MRKKKFCKKKDASELYGIVNANYHELLTLLTTSFGKAIEKEPIPALDVELAVVDRLMTNDPQTDRIYKRISGGFKRVTTHFMKKTHPFSKENLPVRVWTCLSLRTYMKFFQECKKMNVRFYGKHCRTLLSQ